MRERKEIREKKYRDSGRTDKDSKGNRKESVHAKEN